MTDPDDFSEIEGDAREGAVVAAIIIIGFLSFLSGAAAGYLLRGLLG